jgi:hypothetical protein
MIFRGRGPDFKLGNLVSTGCMGSVHATVAYSLITLF